MGVSGRKEVMTKSNNSISKFLLEFGPVLIFFLSYRYAPIGPEFTDNPDLGKIIFATKVFIPIIIISLAISWVQTKELAKMPLLTAIVVLVFGGLTIWLQNDTFIKMKPTIVYVSFGSILAFGLSRNQSYLKSLMGSALFMEDEGWFILTKRFVVLFFSMAIINEAVWRLMSTNDWITFKTFLLPAVTFFFLFFQYPIFRDYLIDKNKH